MVVPLRRNGPQIKRYSDFLIGKRVVVVGPAAYTLGKGLGKWIDDHDVIVRLNWGVPVPESQKDDLGHRTDVLYKRLLKLGKMDFIDLDEWQSEKLKWVMAVDRGQQNANQFYFENRMRGSNIQYLIERGARNELHRDLGTSPFIGASAIYHLLKHKVESVDVVGIDFYQSGYAEGYGGREYRQSLNRKEGSPSPRHNVATHLRWLRDLMAKDSRFHPDSVLKAIIDSAEKPEKLTKGPSIRTKPRPAAKRREAVPVLGVIPARYESSRFPGKPLAEIHGKPMILWTCEAVARALRHFVVATDDPRISEVVSAAGYEAIMTKEAMTGTDRLAQVVKEIKADIYVDIQGDEPLVEKDDIDRIVAAKKKHPTNVVVGVREIADGAESTSVVKAAVTDSGRLLYASRSLIPGNKDGVLQKWYWKHTGLVAFTAAELKTFAALGRKGSLEAVEDVETLRFLELGIKIQATEIYGSGQAVDLPEDIEKVEALMIEQGLVTQREAALA